MRISILTLVLAAVALVAVSCSQSPTESTSSNPTAVTPPTTPINDDSQDVPIGDRREDVVGPTVVSTYPGDNEPYDEYPWCTNIIVTFSEAIDPASIDSTTFNADLGRSGTYTVDGNVVTLDPTYCFDGACIIDVFLSGEIRDLCGNEMGEDYEFYFYTTVDPWW